MSLYDDIISKDTDSDISSDWSSTKTSSIKLLQDHLQIKRTTQNLTKNNNNNAARKMMPITIRQSKPPVNDFPVVAPIVASTFASSKSTSPLGGDWDVSEEYDPRWPNDYEKVIMERSESRERGPDAKKAKKETTSLQITATRSLGLDYDDDEEDYEDERNDEKAKSRASASIAPPPTLLENVEKVSNSVGFGVSSVAAKIMAKMGYKEGQGLGKEEQGISKALQVEKTGKTQGKIIYESEAQKSDELSVTDLLKNPSPILLLRNMVGPGEVDAELEPETKEECSKYGEVIRCVIFERKDYDSDEDAVLIFIEFERVESAIKAFIDLNGRYFGGRVVKASFYDRDRFNKRDFRG